MNKYKVAIVMAAVGATIACTPGVTKDTKENMPLAKVQSLPSVVEVEAQVARIEAKLETKPTIKGLMLVGDGYMYLKRYEEAIKAYQEAHVLSDFKDVASKNKMRDAIFSYLKSGKTSAKK